MVFMTPLALAKKFVKEEYGMKKDEPKTEKRECVYKFINCIFFFFFNSLVKISISLKSKIKESTIFR